MNVSSLPERVTVKLTAPMLLDHFPATASSDSQEMENSTVQVIFIAVFKNKLIVAMVYMINGSMCA